jgi:hypothetical protein
MRGGKWGRIINERETERRDAEGRERVWGGESFNEGREWGLGLSVAGNFVAKGVVSCIEIE